MKKAGWSLLVGVGTRARGLEGAASGASERESVRRTYMVAGSKKLSGYAAALTVFTMLFALLVPPLLALSSLLSRAVAYPSLSRLHRASSELSSILFLPTRRLRSPSRSQARAWPSFPLLRATTKNIGRRAYPWVRTRGEDHDADSATELKEARSSPRHEGGGEVLVISRLSGIACFLESCRSSHPLSIPSRIPNLAIPRHRLCSILFQIINNKQYFK